MLALLFEILSNMFFMALHVVSGGSFPKPLTAKEEHAYFEAFQKQGDITARNALIEHNLRLVAHIIKKYYANAKDQDDLVSIGTFGLIKAVNTFDHTKAARLAPYASRCIENEILMHFRASKKYQKDVSLSEPIDTDKEGQPLTLLDVLADDGDLSERVEMQLTGERLPAYMDEVLNDRERQIISLRYGLYGDPIPQREVAQMLHISRSYVSRIETKAISKLRDRFEQGGR